MTRARRSRCRLLLLITLMAVVPAAVAWAFWSTISTPGGNGAAAATTVNQGATPTAAVAGNAVTVSWAAGTLSTSRAVDGYAITRYDAAAHTPQTTLSACTGKVTATACTENNVPAGQWVYSVTPLVGTNWRGAESAMSATTTVQPADTAAPVNALSLSDLTGNAAKSGNTVYYRGAAAGSFTLTNGVSDTGSGPASSTTATLAGTSTGWTHNPSTVSTPSAGPYVSASFSWTAGTTGAPTETVTGRDLAGNAAATTLSFVNDSAAPVGGTITYTDGYQSDPSVSVAFTAGSDSGSGIATGRLQRATATLAGGTCGTFTGFTTIGPANPASPYVDSQVTNSTCYQYRYAITDQLGNQALVASANVARVDYAGAVGATTGLLSQWRLGEASTSRAVDSKGSNTGDYVNGVTLGATGALAGDPNTAAQFDGVNDYVQVLGSTGIPVGSSLRSVEMWFKTGSSNQQILYSYGTAGNAQEFGLWLDTGGAAMTAWGWGAGNDKSFPLPAAVNNGAWHQVVETYNGTVITLYIDGIALPSQAATRATVMDFYGFGIGAVITPGDSNSGRYFTGYLDEVSLYTTVLTQSTVTNHYALGTAAGDVTGPTGGSVDASGLVGTGSRYSTSTTLTLVLAKGIDPSGVAASGAQLQRSTGTLSAGVCTGFSSYLLITGGTDPASPTTDVVTDQACYRYQYLVSDTLGHSTTYTSGDIKVSAAVPTAPNLAFSALTNTSYATGALTYISNSAAGGAFTTTATTSSSAGAASYTFSSAGTSWTSTAGNIGVNTYSWPGPTAPTTNASISVTVTDNTGRTSAATTVVLTADPLDPPATFTYTRACTGTASVSPAFKAEATAISAVGATSLTIPVPAGTVQGDLLIAGHVMDSTSSAVTATTPTGWTLATPSQFNGNTSRTTTYWRFAPASPPTSYTFTFSGSASGAAGFMASYTGADTTSPIDVAGSQANATSTTVTAPDLTAVSAPTTLVTIMGVDNVATITPTTPTGMTLRAMVTTPDDFGDRDRILHADQPWPSTGATNIRTSSLGANSRASVGVSILVKAAGGGVDPKIDLSWTATPDTYATGYEIIRTGGPTTSIVGRTTLTWTDTATSAGTAYTYTITAVYGSTRSIARTVNVPIC